MMIKSLLQKAPPARRKKRLKRMNWGEITGNEKTRVLGNADAVVQHGA